METVAALLQVRAEAEEKLKKLQQEIAAAEAMGPAQVRMTIHRVFLCQRGASPFAHTAFVQATPPPAHPPTRALSRWRLRRPR